jgi:hypothetical protein
VKQLRSRCRSSVSFTQAVHKRGCKGKPGCKAAGIVAHKRCDQGYRGRQFEWHAAETVSRWNQGRAYPRANTGKTLLELEYIIDQLGDSYEPNEARQWIFAPQELLGGVSPAELIRTGRIDEVMRLVGQLREAVHL